MPETITPCSLTAYRLPNKPSLKLVPAPADRVWMDTTQAGWANRCLPLRMANQGGWLLLNDADFEVTWNGKPEVRGLEFKPVNGAVSYFAVSIFGHGILTFEIPYLFRTSPGWNLLARGPSNEFKDGIFALDGLVETDWSEASFTMNWKITRPLQKIRFEKDEPICMILPQRRGELEAIGPEIRNMESAPEILDGFNAWRESRLRLVAKKKENDPAVLAKREWEGHYMRGTTATGVPAPEHQVKRDLHPFEEREPPIYQAPVQTVEQAGPSILQRWFSKK